MKTRSIEILETDQNKKGDLFGRLMGDLFHVLGYDEPKHNIATSGRVIDLTAVHRTERKIAVAECKAHAKKIGGDDINKFVGSIDAERKKIKRSVARRDYEAVGYFISLSGFRESAIEQENEVDNSRVILIDNKKIVKELILGNILVSIEKAISCVPEFKEDLDLVNYVDLIAYEKGWVWVIYFESNKVITHFSLIHAERKPLIKELADELILIDKKCKNIFKDILYIYPSVVNGTVYSDGELELVKNKYFNYISNECGDIQFEGLPTDKDAGAVKVELENIFVPLHLQKIEKRADNFDLFIRENVGRVLSKNNKIAILAKPGGGKSTLIKRIAIAYAFPERRQLINDYLPDKDLFPIFIRCRELSEKVTHSITEIINYIPLRAELSQYSNQFSSIISDVLQSGNALLLIDGLDEISEDKNRVIFVNQLRTFLATYPNIGIVVTSREAGFRVVGGALANYCDHYKLANLNDREIEELVIKWHRAVIDDTENTISDAKLLYKLITNDTRIKVLAQNPLLLTTLLFVKRWAGYLPTKKSVLYQEMIKLLLVTWNVEGYEQLDIEEAEPQLAYVAFWMTSKGQQTISIDDLKYCLSAARKQMPDILNFTKISISNFIKRVESRSSLLIMSGHKKNDNNEIVPIYEFLHLSFQEHLTAKAVVEKYLPESEDPKPTVEILKPYLHKENWKEVIPLVAVLTKRNNNKELKDLINLLIEEVYEKKQIKGNNYESISDLLGNCIANEIQINPELLEKAIECFIYNYESTSKNTLLLILKSKFSELFVEKSNDCFIIEYKDEHIANVGNLIGELYINKNDLTIDNIIKDIEVDIASDNKLLNCSAVLAMMELSYEDAVSTDDNMKVMHHFDLNTILSYIGDFLKYDDSHYYFCSCWCIAWMTDANLINDYFGQQYISVIVNNWLKINKLNINRMSSWAIDLLIKPSYNIIIESEIEVEKVLRSKFLGVSNEYEKTAAIYVGYKLGVKWNYEETRGAFMSRKEWGRSSKKQIEIYAKLLDIDISEDESNS